jgi:excinuclease ABC subunit C
MAHIKPDHLPALPGIYTFKAPDGSVLYVGKAKSISDRVASYFQNYKKDWKISALLDEHARVDFILTKNETEALLLEAKLIQEHKPKFNVLLKDGQPFLYILFTQGTGKNPLPLIKIVRTKKEKGTYFGPFLQKTQVRSVHRFLIKTFRLTLCNKKLENGCLDYHIGLCAGNCRSDFNESDYRFRMTLAHKVLHNEQKSFIAQIKEAIATSNANLEFEKSKYLHEYLESVDTIFGTIRLRFSEAKFATDIFAVTTPTRNIEEQHASIGIEIQKFLGLPAPVSTIDCFDISHFQSQSIVGSCVRFTNGIPAKDFFRKFNIKTLKVQNDYAALQEIVGRRYKDQEMMPDLILIDGGKGQLSAVRAILPNAEIISLAKREERLYSTHHPEGVTLDVETPVGKIFIALRDYAHHFAISHHRTRQRKNIGAPTHDTGTIHKRKL